MSARLYGHPHPEPAHVMITYRRFLMGRIRLGTARGLIHLHEIYDEYRAAKRALLALPNAERTIARRKCLDALRALQPKRKPA